MPTRSKKKRESSFPSCPPCKRALGSEDVITFFQSLRDTLPPSVPERDRERERNIISWSERPTNPWNVHIVLSPIRSAAAVSPPHSPSGQRKTQTRFQSPIGRTRSKLPSYTRKVELMENSTAWKGGLKTLFLVFLFLRGRQEKEPKLQI